MPSHVHVVIVNYRTASLTLDCLRSIAASRGETPGLAVTVVDNDSRDGSAARLARAIADEGWSRWISLLPAERNGGFAYGNNVGIRTALQSESVEYILLLNPDTVVRPDAIRTLAAFMDRHPGAGIAGSGLENPAGGVECSAHNTPSPLGELEGGARLGVLSRALVRYAVSPPPRDGAHECSWVSGASLIVRRAVLEAVGLLDEGFFLYFEEVDFCVRSRAAGWQVWFVPESRVVHLEGAATGIRRHTLRRPSYWFDSRRRFFVKHYGIGGLLAADLLWALGHFSLALRRTAGLGRGGGVADPPGMAGDLLWGDLQAAIRGRVSVPAASGRSPSGHTPAT